MTKGEWKRLQFLETTGLLLYGKHWAPQLAKDLNLSSQTVYNYASLLGWKTQYNSRTHLTIPPAVFEQCQHLLRIRGQAIKDALKSLQNEDIH
jgi:hypothetical protein